MSTDQNSMELVQQNDSNHAESTPSNFQQPVDVLSSSDVVGNVSEILAVSDDEVKCKNPTDNANTVFTPTSSERELLTCESMDETAQHDDDDVEGLDEVHCDACDDAMLEGSAIKENVPVYDIDPQANSGTVPETSDSAVDITEETTEAVITRAVEFDFEKSPIKYAGACKEFESGKELHWKNFTKGCKWAPDGSCILTNSEDCRLRIFNIAAYVPGDETQNQTEEMVPVLKMKESDSIYDYCWYPLMNSTDPSTCCFASTSRLNPIHLWDAYTGEMRCSYRAYNHVDEIVSAFSLAFDSFGTKLYCGFDKIIRVFDVGVPGRDCIERSLKGKGQNGIISCIAVSPTDSNIYAAGSYLRTIGVYTEPKGTRLCKLTGQIGGITHLMFAPDGYKLFSGGRKDPEIICWDLRWPGRVLYTMIRKVSTNQRIYFDVDSSGTYVASGNSDGMVSVWDISNPVFETEENEKHQPILKPHATFKAHCDCVNGLSFNPTYPIIATSSGQRVFLDIIDSEEEEEEDDNDGDLFTFKNITCDISLMLWWAGK